MAAVSENTVVIRHVQGLAALLASLPENSKTRELLALALDAKGGGGLDAGGRPGDLDTFDGMHGWLESLWTRDGLTPGEQKVVDWQKDGSNMEAVVSEFQGLAAKVQA